MRISLNLFPKNLPWMGGLLLLVACHPKTDDTDCQEILYYLDADRDGYGTDDKPPLKSCTVLENNFLYTTQNGDCNDAFDQIHPGHIEVCDGVDNDCNGLADEDDAALEGLATYYPDTDGDGRGTDDLARAIESCQYAPLSGYSANSTDCNDSDASVYTGNTEAFDSRDNNCNFLIDEYLPPQVTFQGHDFDQARLITVGDANNDGYPDLVISATEGNHGNGNLYVVFGPVALEGTLFLEDFADIIIRGNHPQGKFGASAAIGDFNGDGYNDLVTDSHTFQDNGSGIDFYVSLFPGPLQATYEEREAAWTASDFLSGYNDGDTDDFSNQIYPKIFGNPGDLNLDGIEDFYYRPVSNIEAGELHVYFGRASLWSDLDLQDYDARIMGDLSVGGLERFADQVVAPGDISGDGIPDLLMTGLFSNSYQGGVFGFFGPFAGERNADFPDLEIEGAMDEQYDFDYFGTGLAVVDMDHNDVMDHVLVGARETWEAGCTEGAFNNYVDSGRVELHELTINGSNAVMTQRLCGSMGNAGYLGEQVASSDLNLDGVPDFVYGAPGIGSRGSVLLDLSPNPFVPQSGLEYNAINIFLDGSDIDSFTGGSVILADLDQDGDDEIIYSGFSAGPHQNGETYLIRNQHR